MKYRAFLVINMYSHRRLSYRSYRNIYFSMTRMCFLCFEPFTAFPHRNYFSNVVLVQLSGDFFLSFFSKIRYGQILWWSIFGFIFSS